MGMKRKARGNTRTEAACMNWYVWTWHRHRCAVGRDADGLFLERGKHVVKRLTDLEVRQAAQQWNDQFPHAM